MSVDISGTDDQGFYIDTGSNTLPTQRPSTDIDIHTLTGLTEPDPVRADHQLKLPSPRRSATQRR
jgi:hypothetical protein